MCGNIDKEKSLKKVLKQRKIVKRLETNFNILTKF